MANNYAALINSISTSLMACVQADDLVNAKRLLYDIGEHDRRFVVEKIEGEDNAPLFVPVKRGNVDMVKFLVMECGANLEERGVYENEQNAPRLLVTPLWYSAVTNNLQVASLLKWLGADIDATADTGETAVLYACCLSNEAVVKFLVEHGADIERKNVYGETCLIHATHSPDICQFLIDHGAEVNVQDSFGDLALHHAISRNEQSTVRLLINHGSDPYLENKLGEDAIRTANLRGHEQIANYLLLRLTPPISRWVESYELLGVYFFSEENHDIQTVLNYFTKAISLRNEFDYFTDQTLAPKSVYMFTREVDSVEEMEVLSHNQYAMYMYVLMVRERILGPDNPHTLFGLMRSGDFHEQNMELKRSIELWKYALQQRQEDRTLRNDYIDNLMKLCSLFWRAYEEIQQFGGPTESVFEFVDAFEILEMVTSKMEGTTGFEYFDRHGAEALLPLTFQQLILHLINLITSLYKTSDQAKSFKELVYRLVHCETLTSNGRTFLHLSIDQTMTRIGEEIIQRFNNRAVMEVLLECGADINSVDVDNNTTLHLCYSVIIELTEDQPLYSRIYEAIFLLSDKSAHLDIVNSSGVLSGQICKNLYILMGLKCLAIQTLIKYKIPYSGKIPVMLESFVRIHEPEHRV